jgi:hypothetical protein
MQCRGSYCVLAPISLSDSRDVIRRFIYFSLGYKDGGYKKRLKVMLSQLKISGNLNTSSRVLFMFYIYKCDFLRQSFVTIVKKKTSLYSAN